MSTEEELAHFCRNMRLVRIQHKLTQKEMAAILGIGVGSLRKIESGTFPLRIGCNIFFRFHSAFHIPVSLLFTDMDHLF